MGGGPPVFLQGFSCPAVLWILLASFRFRVQGFHSLRPDFPVCSPNFRFTSRSPKPRYARISVWALSFSLAATREIDFSFFSSPYLDVSVQAVPFIRLWIHLMMTGVLPAGFPHSDIHGSRDICSSPWLFAAYRVLLRLLVPRHPPCALLCLTFAFSRLPLRIALQSGGRLFLSLCHRFISDDRFSMS